MLRHWTHGIPVTIYPDVESLYLASLSYTQTSTWFCICGFSATDTTNERQEEQGFIPQVSHVWYSQFLFQEGTNKTVRKTVLKVNSPKSPKTSSPKSPKTSPKNKEKTPKKNQSPKTKMSPGMKKPSASMSPMKGSPRLSLKDKVKKDNFQNILAKIYNEYDDMKQYNKSFNCPPNCTWAVSLGSKGDDVMCVVWDDYGTD